MPSPHQRSAALVFALFVSSFVLPTFASAEEVATDARPWPRRYSSDGVSFTLYQPDIDVFDGNRLEGRAPMAVVTGKVADQSGKTSDQMRYGVVWFHARTETDKEAREVTLHDVVLDRASFPSDQANEAKYLALARKVAPRTAQVVSLDMVESQLAIEQGQAASQASVATKNDPPEVIVATEPSLLVRVDGDPKWKATRFAGIERLLNSKTLIARYEGKLYLFYFGELASADKLDGPWTPVATTPPALEDAYNQAVAQKLVPAVDKVPEKLQPIFAEGRFPRVYVRSKPAELIEFEGDPGFETIDGTNLSFAVNTPADVFVDNSDFSWYVLLSGRWFKAASAKGPWSYVAPKALPADFTKIPGEHPKSAALASIPGTPEATESLVANGIPQTATVKISDAKFEPGYDGDPVFAPIEGTSLRYARNAAEPVIQVDADTFFGLQDGVWFTGTTPAGSWAVALSVDPAIYRIPASSPLHYVTYVEVYGSSGDYVYVGYTPGYYGTVVQDGVVVYGTGYECDSWVGEEWIPCPATYGSGASFGWTTTYGWGMTYCWGWYDPMCYPWWGPWYGYGYGYPYYGYGWGGAVIGNVYGRWGNTVVGGTGAAWANPWTGNYGRGYRGAYYNERTGVAGVGRGGSNFNAYTGNVTRAAGGVRYNSETGRVSAGRGGSVHNIYSGESAAAGGGATINTDTGRVTAGGGAAVSGDQGAAAGGGFVSSGAAGTIAGIGFVAAGADGDTTSGGLVKVGDEVFAGKDGNIYHRGEDGSWSEVGDRNNRPEPRTAGELDRAELARQRGDQRDAAGDRGNRAGNSNRAVDRASYGGGNRSGSMGGYRGYSGGSGMRGGGGGFRGGGGGRRR